MYECSIFFFAYFLAFAFYLFCFFFLFFWKTKKAKRAEIMLSSNSPYFWRKLQKDVRKTNEDKWGYEKTAPNFTAIPLLYCLCVRLYVYFVFYDVPTSKNCKCISRYACSWCT